MSAYLDRHQTCKPVIVSVVSESPTGGNFIFLRHLNANFVQKCQICVINENLVHRHTAKCNDLENCAQVEEVTIWHMTVNGQLM